ncbi:hypothetical protein L916_21607 [Phytophthora nicotianae]|uniref:Uncharacterized protein n=1 Tax=Phytophthora nicotianae TaxID=4792 RepID=W2HQW3_PHYNI|nr:hypothetical protein L916_21607 [Phytophthora nicotianae]
MQSVVRCRCKSSRTLTILANGQRKKWIAITNLTLSAPRPSEHKKFRISRARSTF